MSDTQKATLTGTKTHNGRNHGDGKDLKPHRAFSRQNAYGFWVGYVEYPCGTVSAVTNAKHTEGVALNIAQRISEGADVRCENAQRDAAYRRQRYQLLTERLND